MPDVTLRFGTVTVGGNVEVRAVSCVDCGGGSLTSEELLDSFTLRCRSCGHRWPVHRCEKAPPLILLAVAPHAEGTA